MAPHHSDPTFWQWLGKFKLTKIILLVTVILLLVPLVIHYYLITLDTRRNIASVSVNSVLSHSHSGQSHRDLAPPPEELAALRDAKDMETRVRELLRIRGSVGSELREMENTRQKLQGDIQRYTRSIEQLKLELQHQQTGLSRLKISVQQAQVAQREALQQNTPDLALPARLTANAPPEYQPTESPQVTAHCRMFSCFDHSRCSLTGGFPVYLYEPDQLTVEGGGVGIMTAGWDVDGFLKTTLRQVLGYNPHLTGDPNEACIYLVLVGEALRDDDDNVDDDDGEVDGELGGDRVKRQVHSRPLDGAALTRLPYWGGDGRNHVLLNLARREMGAIAGDVFRGIDTGKAILVQSTFNRDHFRPGFDLVIAPVLGPPGGDVWLECAPMVPARRHYLLTFQGEMKIAPVARSNSEEKLVLVTGEPKKSGKVVTDGDGSERAVTELNEFILEHLRGLLDTETSDKFKFEFECVPASDDNENTGPQDWALCGTDTSRRALLRQSTFTLIFAPGVTSLLSTTLLQARVYEALRSGAVPIILGGDQVRLPYDEVIQWRRLVLFLPRARITELHFLLRTFSDGDILAMRRQGRLIWERYLASVQSTLDTIIAVIRDRLNIPPLPAETVAAPSVFNDTFQPVQLLPPPGGSSVVIPPPPQPANGPPVDNGGVVAAPPVVVAEAEESLGPLEPPYDSPAYQRNYSLGLVQGHEVWNDWGDPFRLYPAMPNDPVLPSDAKFQGSGRGFRPIALGQGGSGKEFSESLGGNHPREQFTVLLLTYEREQVLLDSISRLRGLPYLHSVVVVWNSPRPPSPDLRWPDIGAPLHVVKAARNSLNNRFLPLDGIETEAVLSVDDDAHLRHDEILFGFRVWREHRDRIVGFPGRYHAWDINTQNSWLYNSNYSCELSMVLTGAAFLHSHYLHLYWKWLPQAIRDKVDEYMNCEDIAMNFLVSHITRAPPIKVTSRWTFRCPGCPQSLSEDETHFQERHKCINFFTQVFGYMPLLNTQYRADSILFKTRIPHDKQKCFKFI